MSAAEARPPKDDAELRAWLENMIVYHNFSTDEVKAAMGLPEEEIEGALQRFEIKRMKRPVRQGSDPILVLPYPGGRHPRIGFLDGAVDPQRETKLSIFLPWDPSGYVVADVPEAIWSNLGLTYLAHTHIPTIWSRKGIDLPKGEWEKLANGDFKMERTLPNGIRFGTLARSTVEAVLMKMWLSNGTVSALSDLRVQNCVMLKGAPDFNEQTNRNKVLRAPFAAVKSNSADRWIITAWQPIDRPWANPPVPCLHADPKFRETAPGETSTLYGLVTFYSGRDIEKELDRLDAGWNELMNF